MSGKNCLIAAETGCGKTLAYLLPMIEQLMVWNKAMGSRPPNTPLALVLCPHRELALQIGVCIESVIYYLYQFFGNYFIEASLNKS